MTKICEEMLFLKLQQQPCFFRKTLLRYWDVVTRQLAPFDGGLELQSRLRQQCVTLKRGQQQSLLFVGVYSDKTPMHCTTGQGRIASLLSSVALQKKLTAGLCHCNYTYADLPFIHACSDATAMHCSTGQGKIASPLFCLLCKTGSQQPCATAIAPVMICPSYRCAVMQDQCTAALVRAR